MTRKLLSTSNLLAVVQQIQEASLSVSFAADVLRVIGDLVPGAIIALDEIHQEKGIYRLQHTYPLLDQEALPYITRLGEVYTQNPIYEYVQQGGKEEVVDISTLTTRADFHATDFYQDIFKPLALAHQIVVRLPREGWITTITINRDKPLPMELRMFFQTLSPHLKTAHRVFCELEKLRAQVGPRDLQPYALTTREIEVLGWLCRGKGNQEIATILGCSSRTVEKHVAHLLEKMHCETRLAAVSLCKP